MTNCVKADASRPRAALSTPAAIAAKKTITTIPIEERGYDATLTKATFATLIETQPAITSGSKATYSRI